MLEDYIEKITPKGLVIRVNSKKNTYMIFKDNEPFRNPRSKSQSIIHELPQIIFLGKEFEIRMSISERIGFFEVVNGQIYIPFYIKGMSDVRHIKLPSSIDSDLLPVYVYQFQSFHVGSIPIFVSSMNYFVVESKIDREMLIRLKMNYPMSRIIVYRGEKDSLLDVHTSATEYDTNKSTRATDLLESDDKQYLAQNPSFAARVHLRRLHFEKIYEILEAYVLNNNDIEIILGYLKIMKNKASDQNEIKQSLQKVDSLIELFEMLKPIFTYEISEVEKLFDQGIPSQLILKDLVNILKKQADLNKLNQDDKKFRFFINTLSMIDPLITE